MIKLADILKEAVSDPLTVFKQRLETGIFSWDKAQKKAGLDFLRAILDKNWVSEKGVKQVDPVDVLAKELFKDEQGKGIPYSKLAYQERVACVKKAFENIPDIESAINALQRIRVGPITSSLEQRHIDGYIRYLKPFTTDNQEGSVKEPLAEAKKKEEPKIGAFEEFAGTREKGAEKIANNAKEKGGPSMLTYHHFQVKLPYYKKAAEGKFDLEATHKEYKDLLKQLHTATKTNMNIDQVAFQKLVGKIEVLGELLIKHK